MAELFSVENRERAGLRGFTDAEALYSRVGWRQVGVEMLMRESGLRRGGIGRGWWWAAMGLAVVMARGEPAAKSIADWEAEAAAVESADKAKAFQIREEGLKATGADAQLVEGAQFTHYAVAKYLSDDNQDGKAIGEFGKAMEGDWQRWFAAPPAVLCDLAVSEGWLLDWKGMKGTADQVLGMVDPDTTDAGLRTMLARGRKARAVAGFMLGDGDAALADWAEARKLDPTLGESPFDPEQLPFNRAIAENPRSAAAWQARAAYLSDRYDAALASDRRFIGVLGTPVTEPGRAEGGEVRAGVRTLMSRSGPMNPPRSVLNDAACDLEQAIELAPKDAGPRLERARLMRKGERLAPRALSDMEEAIAADYRGAIQHGADEWTVRWEFASWLDGRLPLLTAADEATAKLRKRLEYDWNVNLARLILAERPEAAKARLMRLRRGRDAETKDVAGLLMDAKAVEAQTPGEGENDVTNEDLADAAYTEGFLLETLAPPELVGAAYERGLAAADKADGSDRFAVSRDLPARAFKLKYETGDFTGALAMFPRIDQVIDDLTNEDQAAIYQVSGVSTGLTPEESFRLAAMLTVGKIVVLDQLGRIDEARALVPAALKLAPDVREMLSGTREDPERPTNVPLASESWPMPKMPEGTAEDWKKRGNECVQKADWWQALSYYNTALLIDGNYADAWSNRGRVDLNLGRLDLAKTDIEHALALAPEHAFALSNRGDLRLALGDREGATEDYARALSVIGPDHPLHGDLTIKLERLREPARKAR